MSPSSKTGTDTKGDSKEEIAEMSESVAARRRQACLSISSVVVDEISVVGNIARGGVDSVIATFWASYVTPHEAGATEFVLLGTPIPLF